MNAPKAIKTLNDISPGEHAYVKDILTSGNIRRRLMEIGLTNGAKVECLGRSPAGDPSAYLIRGAVIAIRASDCANILI